MVKWRLSSPIQCWQKFPTWGTVRGETFFPVKTDQLWNSMVMEQHSWEAVGARQPGWGGLRFTAPVLQLQLGKRSLLGTKSVLCGGRSEVGFYREERLPSSSIDSFLCKWGLQILTVWMVQIALSLLVRMELLWLVGKDTNEDIALSAQLPLAGAGLQPFGWLTSVGALL